MSRTPVYSNWKTVVMDTGIQRAARLGDQVVEARYLAGDNWDHDQLRSFMHFLYQEFEYVTSITLNTDGVVEVNFKDCDLAENGLVEVIVHGVLPYETEEV